MDPLWSVDCPAKPTHRAAPSQITRAPPRPGFGSLGQKIQLLSNYFAVPTGSLPDAVCLYSVQILSAKASAAQPAGEQMDADGASTLPANISRRLLRSIASDKRWGPLWAFDGEACLFAAPSLSIVGAYDVTLPGGRTGGKDDFCVTLTAVSAEIPVRSAIEAYCARKQHDKPDRALQAIHCIARHARSMEADCGDTSASSAWVVCGRSFMQQPRTPQIIGAGLEVWLGYNMTSRPTQAGMSFVIDRAAAAFVSGGPVTQHLCSATRGFQSFMDGRELRAGSPEWKFASKALKGLKVRSTHLANSRRTYRVKGLTALAADKCMFDNEQLGSSESVAAYMERNYNLKLRYPHLPCVDVSTSPSKACFIPMELMEVVTGQRKTSLDGAATSALIKLCSTRPQERMKMITDLSAEISRGDESLRAFGMQYDTNMRKLDGRVLAAPAVSYGQGVTKQPQMGTWDLKNVNFHTPPPSNGAVLPMAVACFDERVDARRLTEFVKALCAGMEALAGMRLQPAAQESSHPGNVEQLLRRVVEQSRAQLVFVILPEGTGVYEEAKAVLELKLGVISQMMYGKNVNDKNMRAGGGGFKASQFIANLALKIHTKLGGVNNLITSPGCSLPSLPCVSEVPTIVFGADVSHPGKGSDARSVAAVVGSIDARAARYATRISHQPSGVEMIAMLGASVDSLLRQFHAHTRQKPERIIFFRDGVSEGQYAAVMAEEVSELRAACANLGDGSYAPRLTYIICTKRHTTRLFCTDSRRVDRSGNVPPGTVVDTDICSPSDFDFFLTAHAGLQGTTRPVHHHVLVDESNFSADALQQLSFNLSHLYSRCTRSVSLCTPVYYAHLAAFRGKNIMQGGGDGASTEGSRRDYGSSSKAAAEMMPFHKNIGQHMFWC